MVPGAPVARVEAHGAESRLLFPDPAAGAWVGYGGQPDRAGGCGELYQGSISDRYTGQADDNGQEAELPDYQITNLPDGYIVEDIQDAAGLTVIYNLPNAADGKAAIVFYYGYMEDGSMLILDSGDDTFNVTEIQDGDFSGELYEYVDHPDDAKTLVWQKPDRNIMFHISAHGDPDTLLSYARHVEEVKPPLRSTK